MSILDRKFIQNLAEKIAIEAGYASLPVCPKEIAYQHNILVQAKPDSAVGVSGMLIRHGEQFGILYATHINNEGFQRFSVAHELGHYFLEGHPEAVLKDGIHQSQAGYTARDRYEREADSFAAALLMPQDLMKAALRKLPEGLSAIEALARMSNTSISATAFRYSEITDAAVSVVLSDDSKILSCSYSESLKDFAGRRTLPWLNSKAVPSGTLTERMKSKAKDVTLQRRASCPTKMDDWFGLGEGVEGVEEVLTLGAYNRTLTVLRFQTPSNDDYDLDAEIDEDEYLRESWAPKFR